LALGLAVVAFVAGFAWLVREAGRGRARLGLAACLVLVTTPYLAVWYLAWAVPLAAADEDAPALSACLVLCLYLLPQTVPV
jgi:ABC-type transport system involved in cytochrome c biogenesis permease subunit